MTVLINNLQNVKITYFINRSVPNKQFGDFIGSGYIHLYNELKFNLFNGLSTNVLYSYVHTESRIKSVSL